MIYKTKGIVLESFKYRDNQSIVHVLTEEFGKVSYLVYAPQSKRASIRQSNMQVLSILDMEVEHLPHRDLQRIKEAKGYACKVTSVGEVREILERLEG